MRHNNLLGVRKDDLINGEFMDYSLLCKMFKRADILVEI